MTIAFRLPPSAAERVAFSYSPAMEAVLSLHVLVEPKHHPVQHEWVRAMRRHLAKLPACGGPGSPGAIAIAPVIATAIIGSVGVGAGFVLSGGALIVIGATAALALSGIAGRALVYRAIDK